MFAYGSAGDVVIALWSLRAHLLFGFSKSYVFTHIFFDLVCIEY